jgi:hypothetical protein
MKKIIIFILSLSIGLLSFSFAQDEPGFEIIPEASNTNIGDTVNKV